MTQSGTLAVFGWSPVFKADLMNTIAKIDIMS